MHFFTSDLHLGQRNIIKKLTKWNPPPQNLRDFDSVDQMNSYILDSINSYVPASAHLYILGDLYFGKDLDEFKSLMGRINCENKFWILGNHDGWLNKFRDDFLGSGLFKEICYKKVITIKIPPKTNPYNNPWTKQKIILDHYAHRVWESSHRGSWMLYAHSHGSLDVPHPTYPANIINQFYSNKKTLDVGIDNAKLMLGTYRPFSLQDLQKIMEKRNILFIDHHEKRP